MGRIQQIKVNMRPTPDAPAHLYPIITRIHTCGTASTEEPTTDDDISLTATNFFLSTNRYICKSTTMC